MATSARNDIQVTRPAGLRQLPVKTQEELDALLPSVLDKAFKGEL